MTGLEMIKAYIEAKNKEDAAKARKTEFASQIKNHFGIGKHIVEGYKVDYKKTTSTSTDTKSLKAAYPDIVAKFQKTIEKDYFRVGV